MSYFYLVWSNLKRKKVRTTLTLLSIFVAFLLFGILCVIKEAFGAGVSLAGADRLMVMNKMSFIQPLPFSYQARMQSMPGISSVAHISWFGGIYKNDPKNFIPSFPVDPKSYFEVFDDFELPEEQMQAWLGKRNGVVVGKTTMERMEKDGWKIGSKVPLMSPIWGQPEGQTQWEFEIVGVYTSSKKSADLSQFLFRYDYFDEARTVNKGNVGWYSVKVRDSDQAEAIAKRIDKEFANSPYETKADTEAAAMQGFAAQMGDIGTILIAILSAVFFTIVLVAGNTMSQAVRERTEELGVLKAMGFTNELVLVLVLAESCLIATIGGVAGIGTAWLIAAGGSPVPQYFPVFVFTDRDVMIGLGIVLGLGFVAGALPAWQAMQLRIAVALRK